MNKGFSRRDFLKFGAVGAAGAAAAGLAGCAPAAEKQGGAADNAAAAPACLLYTSIALMTITGFIDAPGGTTLGMNDDGGNRVDGGKARDASKKVEDKKDSTLAVALKNGLMTEEMWETKRIGVDKYPAVGAVMWTAHPDELDVYKRQG